MTFTPENRNILFVGLDCATFWIAERLAKEGRMPNLARLMKNGTTVHTETEEPVVSPVVWTSIATAKSPDKHGVKSFHATSTSLRTKRIWDIFLERGSAVGIMGHFVTWPPSEVKGFMVPDLLALDDQAYPPELSFIRRLTESSKIDRSQSLGELVRYTMKAWRYGARLSTLRAAAGEVLKRKFARRSLIDEQFDVRVLKQELYSDIFVKLCKIYRPQYAYFHNHLIDTSSHIFWKYFEPDKFGDVSAADIEKYGGYLLDAYVYADRTLGKIIQNADENTLVVAASDHGAKAAVDTARQWRIPTIKSEDLMQALGIESDVSYSNVGFDILVKPRLESAEGKERLKQVFASIEVVEDSIPLFRISEHDSSNLWLSLNNALEEVEGRHIRLNGKEFALKKFVHASNDRTSGVHDGKNAILVMAGKGVKKGFRLEQKAQVLDIVPTILALSSLPVGRDMDGQVLTDLIEEDFLAKHPVRFVDSYDDPDTGVGATADMESSEELKERLRALGYL
ncbi:hypothetical protein D6833_10225 [Candidatus Parcubacteria bacterium]|nr:MAG: hypothetical protein D6833_10225 [Candidatus Parcubacteria bacterium]